MTNIQVISAIFGILAICAGVALIAAPYRTKKRNDRLFEALSCTIPTIFPLDCPDFLPGPGHILISRETTAPGQPPKDVFIRLAKDTDGVSWVITDEVLRTELDLLPCIKSELEWLGLCTVGLTHHADKICACIQTRELGTH